jgi:hypothetical protein
MQAPKALGNCELQIYWQLVLSVNFFLTIISPLNYTRPAGWVENEKDDTENLRDDIRTLEAL